MQAVKKRTLADLFRVGEELTLTDGVGEPITVYLQKLNPVETETAVRKANAARAVFLADKNDRDSEAYLSALNEIVDFSREELVSYLAADELARRSAAIEAEWAEENGWNEDDYLQSLWDRWNEEGVQESFFVEDGEPVDPDAQKIFDEMQRYATDLDAHMAQHRQHQVDEFETKTDEKLADLMVERIMKMQGDIAWMMEYRKAEIWLGVRNNDKNKTKYFASRAEVNELGDQTLTRIIEAMSLLDVEVDEGKDSAGTPRSSSSSEPPETSEEASSSSPEE